MNWPSIGLFLRYMSELSVRNTRRTREIGAQKALYPGNNGSPARLRLERLSRKRWKHLILRRQWIWRTWNVLRVTRKGTMPTNARMQRAKMERDFSRCGSLSSLQSTRKKDKKSIRQIRIRLLDFNRSYPNPFLRYCIKLYDLAGPIRDELHPGYLAHAFVDKEDWSWSL